jgi:hypothetical protein
MSFYRVPTRYDKNERFYKNVAASSSDNFDYVPADGEILTIINVGVSSSSVPSTISCIAWDADGTPEIIISSYGESNQLGIEKVLTGNGVKVLRINLTNDLTESAYLGGFWQGVIS